MEDSPLVHMDFDVSRYLYEEYYPQAKDKFHKKCLNDQFKYFMDVYPEFYGMGSIPLFLPKGDVRQKEWNDFYSNKLDKFSYELMLQFLKKHYIIIRTTSNKIGYRLRY